MIKDGKAFIFNKKNNLSDIKIEYLADKIPDNDFANSKFDSDSSDLPLRKLIVLFSTERSGSTLLCDLLYKNELCLMHEYFQPYRYMPILAKRWNAIDNNSIKIDKYLISLLRNRVSRTGILGLNLHGSHIYLFEQAMSFFQDVEVEYFVLKREDVLSQAVSYEIASQTQAWSSEFSKDSDSPDYNYDSILNKIRRIEFDNLKINVFSKKYNLIPKVIYFEDLIRHKQKIIKENFGIDLVKHDASLIKQSNEINKSWIEMFIRDFDIQQEKPGFIDKRLSSLNMRIKKILS